MIQTLQNLFQRISNSFKNPYEHTVVHKSAFKKDVPFGKMFPQKGPMVVEFGMGKGQFMREYAIKYPQKNFFGVEKVPKWIRHSAARLDKAKLTNVKIVTCDAESLLEVMDNGSVQEFYILFSDPWPKRRTHNRRIIQTKLIEQIHQRLEDNGKLYIVTDHAEYFEWIVKIMTPFMEKHFKPCHDPIEFISNYQVKYEKEGRKINSIHVRKA
jgi:tRNA (guanine-N7-)-methyltransferase